VLVEQLRAVDIERLGELAGRLSAQDQGAVDDAPCSTCDHIGRPDS
jgi:hypothetical protein